MHQFKTTNIKGKPYVEVVERLKYFRANFADHSLTTEVVQRAFHLARINDAVITGLFVQDTALADYYTVLGGEPLYYEHMFDVIKETLNESEAKTVESIRYFVARCKEERIRFTVHFRTEPVS